MFVDRAQFLSLTAALGACSGPAPELTRPVDVPTIDLPTVDTAQPDEREPQPVEAPEVDASAQWTAMCSAMEPPGPACESYWYAPALCIGLAQSLDAVRGADLMACIEQQNKSENLCDFLLIETCFTPASEAAEDPELDAGVCDDVVTHCVPSLSHQQCLGAMRLTKKSARPNMIACMRERCSDWPCFHQAGRPDSTP